MGLHYQVQSYLVAMCDICSRATSTGCVSRFVSISQKLLSLFLSTAIIIQNLCFDPNTFSRINQILQTATTVSCFASAPLELLNSNLMFAAISAEKSSKPSEKCILQICEILKLIKHHEQQQVNSSLVICEGVATAYLVLVLFAYQHSTQDVVEQIGLSMVHLINESLRTVNTLAELLDEHECVIFTLETALAAYLFLNVHPSLLAT